MYFVILVDRGGGLSCVKKNPFRRAIIFLQIPISDGHSIESLLHSGSAVHLEVPQMKFSAQVLCVQGGLTQLKTHYPGSS